MRTLTKFKGVGVNQDFSMEAFHTELQKIRKLPPSDGGRDLTFKQALEEAFGPDMTPETFYRDAGVDLRAMTVEKILNTTDLNRFLFPEIIRDAIRQGLEYAPFYRRLIAAEERIESTGITMPSMDLSTTLENEGIRLRDTNQGATITEAEIMVWAEKQVTVKKKARGLLQTYESIMFTPIDLARIYFEELGTRLGVDLDKDLINIAINGDQGDGSQAAPVIGAAVANTLAYTDLTRAWTRFRRIGRNSTVMLVSEADAQTILDMSQFQQTVFPNAQTPSGVTLNVNRPLPNAQDVLVHDAMPVGKILFIDTARAFVQLTAMPLLTETERIIRRQLEGEFVSLITGFANIFKNGRMVLDYTTNLSTNPGPTANYGGW